MLLKRLPLILKECEPSGQLECTCSHYNVVLEVVETDFSSWTMALVNSMCWPTVVLTFTQIPPQLLIATISAGGGHAEFWPWFRRTDLSGVAEIEKLGSSFGITWSSYRNLVGFLPTLSDLQTSMRGRCCFSVWVSIDWYVFGLAQFVTEKNWVV